MYYPSVAQLPFLLQCHCIIAYAKMQHFVYANFCKNNILCFEPRRNLRRPCADFRGEIGSLRVLCILRAVFTRCLIGDRKNALRRRFSRCDAPAVSSFACKIPVARLGTRRFPSSMHRPIKYPPYPAFQSPAASCLSYAPFIRRIPHFNYLSRHVFQTLPSRPRLPRLVSRFRVARGRG